MRCEKKGTGFYNQHNVGKECTVRGSSTPSLSPACSRRERQQFRAPLPVCRTSGGRRNTSVAVFTSRAAEGHKFPGEKVLGNTRHLPLSANHHANENNTPGVIWSKELSVRLAISTAGRIQVALQALEAVLLLHSLDPG